MYIILPLQKRLEASTSSHSITTQDGEVSEQQGTGSTQASTHSQDSPMRREGEKRVERVGRAGEGQGVDDVVTPISSVFSPPGACAEDSPFLLNTPEMAQCGEFSGSNAVFLRQLFTFVDNINKVSVCSTPGCHGKLKHISTKLVGLGGDIEVHFDCSGCDRRRLTYPASALHEQSRQPTLSLSLQVACIAAAVNYAQYK